MSIQALANAFVDLLKAGKHDEAALAYNAPDIISIEAMEGPMAHVQGTQAVAAKATWWYANHEIHRAESFGPYVNGEQFAVRFSMDVTPKDGARMGMEEVGLYTVRGDKIVEERFFY